MNITSSAFEHGGVIPARYTCDGPNVSPPLAIEGVPEGAESLTLVVNDPDAPAGTWVHWTLWNIDPSTREISDDATPDGAVEGMTSFGKTGYGGPCPPSGIHRYFFNLYALDTVLEIVSGADTDDLEGVMQGHILAEAQLMGRYGRET